MSPGLTLLPSLPLPATSPSVRHGLAALPSPTYAARYHSLAARRLPDCLRATAHTGDVVMAVEHETAPIFGVQFHPESILTPHGSGLIAAVLAWADRSEGGV